MQAGLKILLPIGILVLGALAAIVVMDREPDPLPQDLPVTLPESPGDPDRGADAPGEFVAGAPRPAKPLVDAAAGKGMISGRIGVSTRVIDRLKSYTIVVQEDVNPNARKEGEPEPFVLRKTFPADLSAGTPYFDIQNVPFSRHPYRVTVIAATMNGSSAITYITAENPTGSDGDVQLTLTPGVYFSVMLRDQRRIPRRDLPVRLVPIGESLIKRQVEFGTSDNNGHVLFENVLQGDYQIVVGPMNAPLAPPKPVTAFPSFTGFDPDGKPKAQGTTVIVPDGHHVTVEVMSRWGYFIENAELKAWQLEVKRYFDFKGTTDRDGRCVFENVPYGIYQLSVSTPENGRRDLKFKVEENENAPIVHVKMPK